MPALNTQRSETIFAEACKTIPGGVNSPVRAFKAVDRSPLFIARAKGARIWDVDGNEFIDFVGSWGPMILGHAHPRVLDAVRRAADSGTSFGASTELEVRMAEMICSLVPSVEMVRMVNSGTEATMSAVRLARAFTGREKIVKFEGCYHGHSDGFLIKAGSGAMTFSVPDSPGVPRGTAAETLTLPFNDLSAVERLLREHPRSVAAMIVEPVVGNMGCVPPRAGYLEGLRKFCTQEGIVLIFDEVITGFRVARGGAQELLGVLPDLTTLGKVIGGGLPVGAYGGRREIMELVAPSGPMYQAGTLSGNPLAMAAGLETLKILCEEPEFYRQLELRSKRLAEGILKNVNSLGLRISINRVGSLSTLFFSDRQVVDSVTALTSDTRRFGAYFRSMLDQGVYLPPSQFEAAFVSRAHTEEDVDRTIDANRFALQAAFA